jgi:hypothetical protein
MRPYSLHDEQNCTAERVINWNEWENDLRRPESLPEQRTRKHRKRSSGLSVLWSSETLLITQRGVWGFQSRSGDKITMTISIYGEMSLVSSNGM